MWARCSLFLGLVAVHAACGAGNAPATPAGAAATTAGGDAGPAGADAAPPPKPFANTPLEATQLISAAVDQRSTAMQKCIEDYRSRKNLPHVRVEISLGIGQEGRLLGATLKRAKPDETLSACVQDALANAPFPRSHAGVISVTKIFEEIAQ